MRLLSCRTLCCISVLGCAYLSSVPLAFAQSAAPVYGVDGATNAGIQVPELPEFFGPPIRVEKVSNITPGMRRFAESEVIKNAAPKNPLTLAPAIRELTKLIATEPNNSDLHLMRAELSCYAGMNSKDILEDLDTSISLHHSKSSAYPPLRERLALKAKVEFEAGLFQDSLRDLDAAVREDYGSAEDVFNDGDTKPSSTKQICKWSPGDFTILQKRFPRDYRPALYRGLYLMSFSHFNLDSDFKSVLDAFEHASALGPTSSLPHYFIGKLYTVGPLGGILSVANAKCLDWVVPRTLACLEVDEIHQKGVRSLTRAIALDSKFRSAYALRADGLFKLKEYRQAIRDYGKVVELTGVNEDAAGAYNDRGLATAALGEYEAAVSDFTQAITAGCERRWCNSYENRAEAYMKLRNYDKAIDDISVSINRHLANATFLMNIDQFRRIYPEYDSVQDNILCEKLRSLFYPDMRYEDFSKQFLIEAKEYHSTVLPELYIKRGDAYVAMSQDAKANLEYDRVSRAFPEWAKVSFEEENGTRVRRRE